jgi:translation initiation factor 1
MPREPKKRLQTDAAERSRAGLNPAFAKLSVQNLRQEPPGREEQTPPLTTWKMGRVILRRSTAKRAGKTVIVVYDFATHLPLSVIDTVAKNLRAGCGCGGTVRDRTIEVQGDQPAKIRALLEGEGFEVAGVT